MLHFLTGDLQSQDPQALSYQEISNLSTVIPALSYTFLQALSTPQFLPALSDLGSARLTPAQARVFVQKILNSGKISDEMLSHMGSLVLGLSPMFLRQLSANQLTELLPALTNHSRSLSYAQTLAAMKTLWGSWNVTLHEWRPLLHSLPLIYLRPRAQELVSDPKSLLDVRWNQQQALLLFHVATQTMEAGVRSSANSAIGQDCDLLQSILQDKIQNMTQYYDIINSLPRQLMLCALDQITSPPPTLLKRLTPRNLAEIHPTVVSLLPQTSCRIVLNALRSEPRFVAELPQQRRFALLDALVQCLNSGGTMSTTEKLVNLGLLTPFLQGATYQVLSQNIIRQSVEQVTSYCYPQETRLLLAQLLQAPQAFRSPTLWTSSSLERLDRLVPLLPVSTLQSLSTTAISSQWVIQILSEEHRWRKSPLGDACTRAEDATESQDSMQRRRTLLKKSSLNSASGPECNILRDSIVSAWGVELLLAMAPTDFMDCLEVIGQDPVIPTSELTLLLARVLQVL
ncbi:uncharacterized protein LOC120930259 [Rana temporaria]|uniref:uncharacterized protein LOC120930259 n=1 Tax=Rana temporaria TaxID=8407 RepID=UPI001AAD7CF9|nr:uncharacterized protein LOC120930259 [Rana temporaria]